MSISNAKIRVRCEFLAEDGQGIALVEGVELHVRDLLPGEIAEVYVDSRSKHHKRAWGHIVERIGDLSLERRVPVCPAFGACGGCAWQQLSYEGQLEQKRNRVERALALLSAPPAIELPLAAPQTLGYRNKGKYVFGMAQGEMVLGAYKPRTHEVASTIGCKIVEDAIDEVAGVLLEYARTLDLAVYDESNPSEHGMRYAILRSNQGGLVLVTLVCSSGMEKASVAQLAYAIGAHPRVVGVLRCDNDLRSGGLLTDHVTTLCGAATLEESLVGVTVALGSRSFWQINRTQAEQAYRAIGAALPVVPNSHVLELYSGTGGIAFALAASGHQVLGIDLSDEAVGTANQAAEAHGLTSQVRFRCQDATRLSPEDFASVSAVVVDPPRKGLGERGVAQLCAAKPGHIAYLSCGPESLARDLAQLEEGGYRIESLQLFDFMPGTAQVECLAILRLD